MHLKVGDIQVLTVSGPRGEVLSLARMPPLDRDKAQTLVYAGVRRPAGGWAAGTYSARYQVLRSGREVVARTFSVGL